MAKKVASLSSIVQSSTEASLPFNVGATFGSTTHWNGNSSMVDTTVGIGFSPVAVDEDCDPALNTELIVASQYGDLNRVKKLLIAGAQASASDSQAIRIAASNGHFDCVDVLLPHSNIEAEHSEALLRAAEHGYPEIVQLLLDSFAREVNHVTRQKALGLAKEFRIVSSGAFAARVPTPLNGHQRCIEILCALKPRR